MKTHIRPLLLALAAMLSTAQAADTPAAILADYRAKAETALAKVNGTLEKATVPLIADLVKSGDTAGAEELKTQLKAKQSGDAVAKPHAKAANLFTLYDAARTKALEPAQKAAVARIEALLASSDGKKLKMVEEAGKVRAEIEAGKLAAVSPKELPPQWSYHLEPTMRPSGSVEFLPRGVFVLKIAGRQPEEGKWKQSRDGTYSLTLGGETFAMKVQNTEAVLQMAIGNRYLKVIPDRL